MIGWGWVVSSGGWIQKGGVLGAALGFVLGGIMIFFVGLTYAELTAAMPQCGGMCIRDRDSDTTPDGSKAVPIYGSDYYAYGYDVAVAQKLADEMGMDLEVHNCLLYTSRCV